MICGLPDKPWQVKYTLYTLGHCVHFSKRLSNSKNMFLLQVALIDQDKGNIMDIKNKKYVRAIPVWGGACSSDGRYGIHFKIF